MRLTGLRIHSTGASAPDTGRLLICPAARNGDANDLDACKDIDDWLRNRQPVMAVVETSPAGWFPPRRARYVVRLLPAPVISASLSPSRHLIEHIVLQQQGKPGPLLRAIIDRARVYGSGRTILRDTENTLSYRALLMRSFILSRLIGKHTEQKAIAILLPTSAALTLSFLAIHWRRRTPVMLNFTQGLTQCLLSCEVAGVGAIISSRRFLQQAGLNEWQPALQKHGLLLLEDLVQERTRADTWAGLCTALAPGRSWKNGSDVSADEAAVILFTSGSEGQPKGVVLSHANLMANHAQVIGRLHFYPEDVLFNCLPAFHSFGLGVGIIMPLLAGWQVQLYPSPLQYRSVVEQLKRCGATVFFSTDTFLRQYIRYADRTAVASLRLIFAGAEPLNQATIDIWKEKLGHPIQQGYGLTETSPVAAFNHPGMSMESSVGQLVAGMEYRLQPVPGIERGGRLLMRGPNVMRGYLTAGRPTGLEPPPEGWFDTGDIAEINEQGFLFIHGRLKRFVKTGGEMVSLDLIEKLTRQLWPEYQHVAVGIPDPRHGERVTLMTTYPQADLAQLCRHIQSCGYNAVCNPTRLLHQEELPALTTGKPDYPAIKKIIAMLEQKTTS